MSEKRHLFLYAKGWYKKTNTLDDLKRIVSHISWIDVEHINKGDVIAWLVQCIQPYVTKAPNRFSDLMGDWFANRDMVEAILSMMSVMSHDDMGMECMPPNYDILPMPDDCEHTIKTLKEWGYLPEDLGGKK